jgi:hypothetical protein
MKVLQNVDLAASFEKLKTSLLDANKKTKGNDPDRYAYAFGYLNTAVIKHLRECTDDPGWTKQTDDDIPPELFNRKK